MRFKNPTTINAADITEEAVYRQRREFLGGMGALGMGLAVSLPGQLLAKEQQKLAFSHNQRLSTLEEITERGKITAYNNYYEFGTDKYSPAKLAHSLTTHPWSVTVEGEAEKTGVFNLEDILHKRPLEERIYRLRCVEGWSMVIPWVGFPLGDLMKTFAPTSKAKYVEFTTLARPSEMPGLSRKVLDWPYVEGLRMDEAMHPLTILAVGLYGESLPNQNGAPLRLVVPWKYGFKSIKSIVKIRFTEQQPISSWTRANADEYGFYSNVNPTVAHPRWSQKRERRIGDFLKRETLMFNGYADEVASLYNGMDLKTYF